MLNKFLYRWAPSGLFQPSTKNEHSSGARSMGEEDFFQKTADNPFNMWGFFSINVWRIFLNTQIKIIFTTISDCEFSFEKSICSFQLQPLINFHWKTNITVNFVLWWRSFKKSQIVFCQPGEEDEVLRGHRVGHLQLSRDQGRLGGT